MVLAHAAVFWERRKGSGAGLFLLGAAWLLFFPNAPYIVTDFLHLKPRGPVPLWYDCVLLFSFAWNGALFGFYSLRIMHAMVERLTGPVRGWLFVFFVCVLAGLGVYLGRFERWNSWDIVHRPAPLIQSTVTKVIALDDHPRTAGIVLVFSAFLLSGYCVYHSAGSRADRDPERVSSSAASG